MRVKYSPVFNEFDFIKYTFKKDIVIANINGEIDVFDFSDMPNVELNTREDIDTELPTNPFLFVSKENGVLSIELLNYIGENASHEERFPDWIDLDEEVLSS